MELARLFPALAPNLAGLSKTAANMEWLGDIVGKIKKPLKSLVGKAKGVANEGKYVDYEIVHDFPRHTGGSNGTPFTIFNDINLVPGEFAGKGSGSGGGSTMWDLARDVYKDYSQYRKAQALKKYALPGMLTLGAGIGAGLGTVSLFNKKKKQQYAYSQYPQYPQYPQRSF